MGITGKSLSLIDLNTASTVPCHSCPTRFVTSGKNHRNEESKYSPRYFREENLLFLPEAQM
uniref:Uncharacterized protein n=1 Tax=Anguilla anguilla TaxID=7936 RepID=A0A0E9XTH7_ANGAN